jgi:hypothetical protein
MKNAKDRSKKQIKEDKKLSAEKGEKKLKVLAEDDILLIGGGACIVPQQC